MITGKHAVVTGGGTGIGLAVARALKARGAVVSVLSRSAPDTGDGFHRVSMDVTDEGSVRAAFAQCRQTSGPVAMLVNNSGIAESAPIAHTDSAMWNRIIATNLTGTYLCTHEVIDEMLCAKWGRIVNVASIAGLYGAPYLSAYTASKHGVVGFTRALAAELAQTGVTANAVCPGYTATGMMDRAIARIVQKTGRSPEQARDELAHVNPAGRIVRPEEVADVVVEFCLGQTTGAEVVLPQPA